MDSAAHGKTTGAVNIIGEKGQADRSGPPTERNSNDEWMPDKALSCMRLQVFMGRILKKSKVGYTPWISLKTPYDKGGFQ